MTLSPGDRAPDFEAPSHRGGILRLADLEGRKVLLCFHRFAGCPACSLSVHEFVARHDELVAAGLTTMMFFHTPIDELRAQMEGQHAPFDILADPDKAFYEAYGVTSGLSALMSPSFMGRSMVAMTKGYLSLPFGKHGGITGRPANFLLDEGGTVLAAHYGRHAGDSWSVDEALAELAPPAANAAEPARSS